MGKGRRVVPTSLKDILKSQTLYERVPVLKLYEIEYFLDRMDKAYSKFEELEKSIGKKKAKGEEKTKVIKGEDWVETGLELSYLASAFFSAVISFFDTLAIFHTKNREEVYDDIHFTSWLNYQKRNSPDDYIKYLENEDADWIKSFRKNRNIFIHQCHPYILMSPLFSFVSKNETIIIENFLTELTEVNEKKVKKIQLVLYCREIRDKLLKLEKIVAENRERILLPSLRILRLALRFFHFGDS